jgi:hypothetical protein
LNEAGAVLMTQHDETAVKTVPTLSRLSLKAISAEVESKQAMAPETVILTRNWRPVSRRSFASRQKAVPSGVAFDYGCAESKPF